MPELLTIKQASNRTSDYLDSEIIESNISHLIQYGRIKRKMSPPLQDYKKERIALEVIRVLGSRFDNFPEDSEDNRNVPFHEAFLNAFAVAANVSTSSRLTPCNSACYPAHTQGR